MIAEALDRRRAGTGPSELRGQIDAQVSDQLPEGQTLGASARDSHWRRCGTCDARLRGVTTIVRCAALWLSGAALGVSAAFFSYQAAFFPDVYFVGYLILNALLLVVALFAGAISLRPSLCPKVWTAPLLGVGHVTAAVGTHEFLRSRITCFSIQQAVDYWLPTDSGPLLLFGPSLAALAASALWKRLRRPRPPATPVL